jgi:hypothetical protein
MLDNDMFVLINKVLFMKRGIVATLIQEISVMNKHA